MSETSIQGLDLTYLLYAVVAVLSAKQETELLMHQLLAFAARMLQDSGEFHLYGGVLLADESIVRVDPSDPDPFEALRRELRERLETESARAAAIVRNTRVMPPGAGRASDAIEVLVQHRSAYCADVFFPYQLKDGRLTFGQVFAQTCGRQILA